MKSKPNQSRFVISPGVFNLIIICFLCTLGYVFVTLVSSLPLFNVVDRSAHYNVKVLPSVSEVDMEQLSPDTFSYMAMIDAGSSGCRVHVYRYGKLGDISGPLYVLPKHISMKVRPGLSSFAKNPEAAGPSLEQLVDFLKKNVPSDAWTDTPIWLKATAGLRLVKESESNAILKSVRDYLTNESPFLFRPSYAKIISGQEEGAFGWIAFNYLQKIIGPKSNVDASGQAIAPRFPYTVVEMGGASSQVTQRVPAEAANTRMHQSVRDEHYYTVNIEKEKYNLYTFSYLGYGAEQAREKLNTMLQNNEIKESTTPLADSTIHDPCLNNGFSRDIGEARDSVYEGSETVSYKVEGASVSSVSANGDLCFGAVMEFLNNNPPTHLIEHECNTPHKSYNLPHSFDCVHQPKFVIDSLNFLVFENFFYSSSAANVLPANHAPNELSSTTTNKIAFPLISSPLELKEAAAEVCRMEYKDVLIKYPKDGQTREVGTKLCFSLSYAAAFLIHGLHVPENKFITIQKEVNGDEIEWALGAAYKEASDFLKATYLRPN